MWLCCWLCIKTEGSEGHQFWGWRYSKIVRVRYYALLCSFSLSPSLSLFVCVCVQNCRPVSHLCGLAELFSQISLAPVERPVKFAKHLISDISSRLMPSYSSLLLEMGQSSANAEVQPNVRLSNMWPIGRRFGITFWAFCYCHLH